MEPGLKDRQLKDTLEDTEQFEEMIKKKRDEIRVLAAQILQG